MLQWTHLIRRKNVPIFILALFVFVFWLALKSQKPTDTSSMESKLKDEQITSKTLAPPETEQKTPIAKKKTLQPIDEANFEAKEKSFSFAQEAKRVEELSHLFPSSKNQLLQILIQEDIYKAHNIKVEAHTKTEITQNQMGAIKVLALKALFTQETNLKTLIKDLDHIIKNAKDPTIKNIAIAAKESASKGRPFFKDFIDGLANMSN